MPEPEFMIDESKPAEVWDFTGTIRVPVGCRILSLGNMPLIGVAPDGRSRLYVHPEDVQMLEDANPNREVPKTDA